MKKTLLICASLLCILQARAGVVLKLPATGGVDDTQRLREIIERAAGYKGKPVTILLEQGDYHLSREQASTCLYHVSNTTSEEENALPVKHIGLWLKHLKNVTIDGGGACLITHGEMTTFVVDSCENIVLRNFTVKASDPSLPEITVVETGEDYIVARTASDTRYAIRDGRLYWRGEGWEFTGGIAQVFYPASNVTVRTSSPMDGLIKAVELERGLLKMYYGHRPAMQPGEVYQMRHSFRTEVCGFINRSCNVTLRHVNLNFLGNFGVVGQYSENLTYDHLVCAPALGGDRSGVGFADFVQMSGCRGKISITDSRFEGAHDDPINIHGTHLKVVEYVGERQVKVRFMHGQSYGFEAFSKGDKVEMVDAHSLLCLQAATVKKTERVDDYTFLLTLNKSVGENVKAAGDVSVENVTWTPEVYIARNYFARIPTRGILVTTRRKVVIEGNVFYRLPMSAVLVSDDARSWYESGPAYDVTIRRNEFIECGSPVVNIAPEIGVYKGAVHRNVRVCDNRFRILQGQAVSARAVDGLTVTGNYFETQLAPQGLVVTDNCHNVKVENNRKGWTMAY